MRILLYAGPPSPTYGRAISLQMSQSVIAIILNGSAIGLLFYSLCHDFRFACRMKDLETSKTATVRNGSSITRRQSAASAGVDVDIQFGQRVLGPPTAEHISSLCIWVGQLDAPKKAPAATCCLVRLVKFGKTTAVVRTMKSSTGEYLGSTKEFVE